MFQGQLFFGLFVSIFAVVINKKTEIVILLYQRVGWIFGLCALNRIKFSFFASSNIPYMTPPFVVETG